MTRHPSALFVPLLALLCACGGPAAGPGPAPEAPVPAPAPTPPAPSGPWLGESPPGAEPTIFAPGFVSTDAYERDIAWTPDGRQVFWTVFSAADRFGVVVSSERGEDGSWSPPEIPAIFRGHDSLEPFVTVDGAWLWFASDRPLPGESEPGDWNLWRSARSSDGWGEPEPLPAPINLDGDEFYPSLTRDGAVVFTATREGSIGGEDLFVVRADGEGWGEAENLGPAVNSEGPEFNSLIHPDGDWILFGSLREGDQGGGDLYVSRSDGAGGWLPAEALPAPLNSPALDFCPALSPDGSLLFFSSRRSAVDPASVDSYGELMERLRAPGNGQSDVWWVDAAVLAEGGIAG